MMFPDEPSELRVPRIMSDARVLDVAIAAAVSRNCSTAEELEVRITEWFGAIFDPAAIRGRLSELQRVGWLKDDRDGCLWLTPYGVDCVTQLYGGTIRMLDRGQGLIKQSILTKVFFEDGEKE